MTAETTTMLVRVPRWTQAEMVAVATAERLDTWREADLFAHDCPTDVSLDVQAPPGAEARAVVRAALGPLPLDAFRAST